MADTTFVQGGPPTISAAWLQDLNNFFYRGAPAIAISAGTVTATTSVVTPKVDSAVAGVLILATGGGSDIICQVGSGNVRPNTDGFASSGLPANRWKSVFTPIIDSGTTGSLSLKTNNGTLGLQLLDSASPTSNWGFSPAIGNVNAFAQGATNSGIFFVTKGTGSLNFLTGATNDSGGASITQFEVIHQPGATSHLQVAGSAAGTPTIFASAGSPAIVYASAGGSGTPTNHTLKMYEEGTWIPSLGGTTTYTTQVGSYTKVGRLVTFSGLLTINTIGTGSTTTISGLPFTNTGGATIVAVGNDGTLATAIVSMAATCFSGANQIQIFSRTVASTAIGSNAIFKDGTGLEFSGHFMAAS
jgi:hypothetical protein